MGMERLTFNESDEIEIRIPLYRSFSNFCNMYLVVFPLKFFIHLHMQMG